MKNRNHASSCKRMCFAVLIYFACMISGCRGRDVVLKTETACAETISRESSPLLIVISDDKSSETKTSEKTSTSTAQDLKEDTDVSTYQLSYCQEGIYTYVDLENDISRIQSGYPGLVETSNLGETFDGRNIYCIRIGKSTASKNILIGASIHAREYITSELVMKMTFDYLNAISKVDFYGERSYRDFFEETAVYIVPMINPDGVTISQFGLGGLQTQAAIDSVNNIAALDGASDMTAYLKKWKSNAEGIDINRQFEAMWSDYNDHVGHPSADHYKGPAPACTVEARALIELSERVKFDRTVSYHTQGRVIYCDCALAPGLSEKTLQLAKRFESMTGYSMVSESQGLDPAGYRDWVMSSLGVPSVTVEVGSGENPISHGQFNQIYEENKHAIEETILSMD